MPPSLSPDSETAKTTLRIPRNLLDEFDRHATSRGMTRSEAMRRLMRRWNDDCRRAENFNRVRQSRRSEPMA